MKFFKNKIVLTLIAIALIRYLCVGYFFRYSVYYAQHMKHKQNACPEIVMMAHNYKYLPSSLKEIYFIESFGEPLIQKKDSSFGLTEFNKNDYYFSTSEMRYSYNGAGRLIECSTNQNFDPIKITDKVVKRANVEVSTYLTEYNQELSKPLINLQGLFNYLYEDRFN